MRLLTFFFVIGFFFSCETKQKVTLETRQITINNLTKDSIIVFLTATKDTLGIYREVEITENENTDTLSLGFGIIHPGYVGKMWFIQTDLNPSNAAYLERAVGLPPDQPWSYGKLFTIGMDNQKNYSRGFKKITVRLKITTIPLKHQKAILTKAIHSSYY
jgi:hypothetical protein